MQANFFCKTGALAGSEYRIGDNATIGRGSGNTIVLPVDVVSKTHARISYDPAASAWFLEDLDSTNGTRLDGVPVSGRERLDDLHVVTLGEQHDFVFVVVPTEAARVGSGDGEVAAQSVDAATRYESPSALDVPSLTPAPEPPAGDPGESAVATDEAAPAGRGKAQPTWAEAPEAVQRSRRDDEAVPQSAEPATRYEPLRALDVPPLGAESGRPSRVVIEILVADGKQDRIVLDDGRYVVGRAKDCAVAIDDMTLSRRHATLVVRGHRMTVMDLDSLNGTFIGEAPVESETEVEIGHTVTFGNRVKVVRVAP